MVKELLDNTFGVQWFGHGVSTHWLERSLDLNPLDFCMWRYLEDLALYLNCQHKSFGSGFKMSVTLFKQSLDSFEHIRQSLMPWSELWIRNGWRLFSTFTLKL
jgi:hypothetical protein